jgi:hypothetical protein
MLSLSHAVLLDGARTPSGSESGCTHGVAWYSRTLGSTLVASMTQSAESLTDTLADGIKAVASLHDSTYDLAHPGTRQRPWSCSGVRVMLLSGSAWPTPRLCSTLALRNPW